MYRCIRIAINNTNPTNNSIAKAKIQPNPSLLLACLINSLSRYRFTIAKNICPSKLIKLTCQKLKEIEHLIALIPKNNWNINGKNKRRRKIIEFIMSFLFFKTCCR